MSMTDAAQDRKATAARNQQIASVIVQQLGGNKFIVMTGAKRVTVLDMGVGFQLPTAAKGINWVEITLDYQQDLYRVGFYTVNTRTFGKTEVHSCDGLDVEQMVAAFKDQTGLSIRL